MLVDNMTVLPKAVTLFPSMYSLGSTVILGNR